MNAYIDKLSSGSVCVCTFINTLAFCFSSTVIISVLILEALSVFTCTRVSNDI